MQVRGQTITATPRAVAIRLNKSAAQGIAAAYAISSAQMASKAATGSSAPVIGRPMTSLDAPASIAAAGVAMRYWSPTSAPAGRTPGVTMRASGPRSARISAASCGEQTMPSAPEP